MTYSRPATTTVDALARVPTPNSASIIGDSRVSVSRNGAVIDPRNPSQIAANGRAQAAEVTNFIEGLTKVAKPLIDDAFTKQANQQVGELLKTQDPVLLMQSAGTPENRAILRGLSPQALSIVEDMATKGSVRAYQDNLATERLKRRAVLQNPASTVEELTQAQTDSKASALDRSGITKMPSQALARYGETLVQTDAALSGQDNLERAKASDRQREVAYEDGLIKDWGDLVNLTQSLTTKDPASAAKGLEILKGNLETVFKNDSSAFLPSEQAKRWGSAFESRLRALVATKRYDDADALVKTMQTMAELNPVTPSKALFFDQKLDNNYSLRDLINEKGKQLQAEMKQYQREQALEMGKDAIRASLLGDENAEALAENVIRDPRLTADQLMTIAPALSQAESIGSKPSNAQLLIEADLRYEIAQGGFDPEQMLQKVKTSGLRPQQILGLSGSLVNGSSKSTQLVAGAREYLGSEVAAASDLISRAAGITDEGQAREIGRNLLNATSRAAEVRIEKLQAAGEQVDAERARDIFRNELEAVRNTRLKDAGASKLSAQNTFDRKVANELQEFATNVQASKGEVTVMSFPKEVRVGFQAAFPNQPMSVPRLEKYFMSRMQQVKDGDKPIYADPQKTLRETIRTGQKGGGMAGMVGPALDAARKGLPPSAWAGSEMAAPVLQMVGGWIKGGQSPAKAPDAKSDPKGPQSSAGRSNPVVAMVNGGLSAVSQVLTPPAAAGTLDQAPVVRNQQAVEAMARIWARREPLRMSTQPLPQVDSRVPVEAAPLRINHDKHPMFVAIGIAEGTRTPSGGYTQAYYGHRDPGDGHFNRGTVSGGRGSNASPAAVDRQWMGTLTQRSMGVAPILQRLGLRPGTQGWNRVLFNVLDLQVQAPLAAPTFIQKLTDVVRKGATIEAIAKARADSFFNPATGRLDAGGFGNSYSRLFNDQRSRAGVWDYRRRI